MFYPRAITTLEPKFNDRHMNFFNEQNERAQLDPRAGMARASWQPKRGKQLSSPLGFCSAHAQAGPQELESEIATRIYKDAGRRLGADKIFTSQALS